MADFSGELSEIARRYERRTKLALHDRYAPWHSWPTLTRQEFERALVRWLHRPDVPPIADMRLLEVGCGTGANLHQFVGMGATPGYLIGNELLPERAERARARLPSSIDILEGDASALGLQKGTFDVVMQATVFSSILDRDLRSAIADRMWSLVRPGGGVLSYDLAVSNPFNPDVVKIDGRELRRLFPGGRIMTWRLTLAPPLARKLVAIHPSLYGLFNALPLLRTHLLCWATKD